jgi:hypothetical protein
MANARALSSAEQLLASGVFHTRLPLDRILITDLLGAGGRPFTVPSRVILGGELILDSVLQGNLAGIIGGWVFGEALAGLYDLFTGGDQYFLNLGPDLFNGDATMTPFVGRDVITGQSFIHELTHVWQGENEGIDSWGFVCDSLWCQATDPNNCYGTMPSGAPGPILLSGNPWQSFTVEQKAMLIELWFQTNMGVTTAPSNQYVDHVRGEVTIPLPRDGTVSPIWSELGPFQGWALDVPNGDGQDGTPIQIYPFTGADNQHWRFLKMPGSDEFYMIQNVNSGKVIDVPSGSMDPIQLQQFTPNGGDNQQWQIVRSTVLVGDDASSTERLKFVNKNSKLVIDLPGGLLQPGNFIQQFTPDAGVAPAQLWNRN